MQKVINKYFGKLKKLQPRGMQSTIMIVFSVISISITLILGIVMYIRFSAVNRQETIQTAQTLMEQTGETLEDYRLDNETCLEALQEIVDAYREELGLILGEARFWEREEQKHLEEMARGINEAYGSEL